MKNALKLSSSNRPLKQPRPFNHFRPNMARFYSILVGSLFFLVSVFGPKSLIKLQAPVRGKLEELTVGILCRQPTPSFFSHPYILYYIYVRHKNTILSDPFKKIFSLLCIKLSSERLHDKKNI